jgi:hypothetical protein
MRTGIRARAVRLVLLGVALSTAPAAVEGGNSLLLSDVASSLSTATAVETGLVAVRVCSWTGTAVRTR